MSPTLSVIVAFIALAIVGVIVVAILAVMRTDPTRPRLPYEMFLRLTGLSVFCVCIGLFGAVAGFAFMLGSAS